MSDRNPRPPAEAYRVVAPMLPDWYFVTPPPVNPTVVSVMSVRDQIRTEWAMTPGLAKELVAALKQKSGLHVTSRVERNA